MKKIIFLSLILVVPVISFFLIDEFIYENRLTDNEDKIEILDHFTLKKIQSSEIIVNDSSWVLRSNLELVSAKIIDSLGNYQGIIIDGLQQGFWKYFHKNGMIQAELHYLDGNGTVENPPINGRVRECIYWYDNGQKNIEYSLDEQSRKQGFAPKWYENGNKYLEMNFKDDKLHGAYKRWYEDGQIKEQSNYVDGKLHGAFKRWFKNGQLDLEQMMENGYVNGMYKWWHENGVLGLSAKKTKTDSTFSSQFVGLFQKWYENGSKEEEGTYDLPYRGNFSEKSGLFTKWYENGNLKSSGEYTKGWKIGTHKDYDIEGVITMSRDFNFNYTLKKSFEISRNYYVEGNLHQKTYFLKEKGSFDENKEDYVEWYENGKRIQKQFYRNGVEYGKRIFFN